MVRLQTQAKKKLNKALRRVEKIVIYDIRKNMENQTKWKAKILKNFANNPKKDSNKDNNKENIKTNKD